LVPRETVITGDRDYSAASSATVRALDLELRLVTRPGDILKNLPGLITSSHQGGGGKADQYFLRGFDADHGTDVALFYDGVPINLPTHAHGQGYADFNFVIPELVQRVDINKGPYYVELGDFATAGAINVYSKDWLERDFLRLEGGMLGTYRVLGATSPTFGQASAAQSLRSLWAAEVYHTDGPFLSPNNLQRYNLNGKETLEFARGRLQLQVIAYGAGWNSSGQIPARAVDARLLDRFGAVDPTEGGSTQRQFLILSYTRRSAEEQLVAQVYYQHYKLALWSNFTFFARDPVNGDQIEQDDSRNVLGGRVEYRRRNEWRGVKFEHTAGFQFRTDLIDVQLWHDKNRERIEPLGGGAASVFGNNASVTQENLAGYLQEDIRFGRHVRLILGARVDYFNFDVTDHNEDLSTLGTKTSGTRQQGLVSPKANLVVTPLVEPRHRLELFANFGTGYHSNDARVVIRRPDDVVIPRAIGAEGGARFHLELPKGRYLDLAAAGWYIYLQSETVFSGDDGVFEQSNPTQRYGVDAELRARLMKWLWADVDASFAHAEFTGSPPSGNAGNGTAVALAPRRIIQAGLTFRHPVRGGDLRSALRLRHVGDRPATQDGSLTALGYTVLDFTAAYAYRWFEVGVILENVLNSEWREAQFADSSQLRPTPSAPRLPIERAPVQDIHFVPGNPINVRGAVTAYF
jgi:outer membrane receptor protein involved in Fe transport